MVQPKLDLGDNRLENLCVKAGTIVAFIWIFARVEKSIEVKNFMITNEISLQDARV